MVNDIKNVLQIAADTLVLNDEYLFGHKRRAFIIEENFKNIEVGTLGKLDTIP